MINLVIGAVGARVTLGLVSGVTSAVNGMFTLCKTISSSTSSGAEEVKHIIKETGLEFKIGYAQSLVCELKKEEDLPFTIHQCVKSINDAIKDISDEMFVIHYRMQYNDNLRFGSTLRAYKFHNCKARLESHIKNLEARCDTLIKTLPIRSHLVKNPELEDPSKQVLQIEETDYKSAKRSRENIYKTLDYIKK